MMCRFMRIYAAWLIGGRIGRQKIKEGEVKLMPRLRCQMKMHWFFTE